MSREFTVTGLPAPQGSKRHVGGGRMIESSKHVKRWRQNVASAYLEHDFGAAFEGPVLVWVNFYLPRPLSHSGTGRNAHVLKRSAPIWHTTRPDLDKLTRAVGDALTRLAWRDDSQIVCWCVGKYFATPKHPVGAVIVIEELGMGGRPS